MASATVPATRSGYLGPNNWFILHYILALNISHGLWPRFLTNYCAFCTKLEINLDIALNFSFHLHQSVKKPRFWSLLSYRRVEILFWGNDICINKFLTKFHVSHWIKFGLHYNFFWMTHMSPPKNLWRIYEDKF